MRSLIKADKLCVSRGGKEILNNVNLTVNKNDFTTIIGPNGAGKSVLLKCILGFYKVDSGEIKRNSNLKIGYVPQRFVPDHAMPITTKRFVSLRKKVSSSQIEKIAKELQIEDLLDKQLNFLSGGELQKVLLTRALLNNPNLLILDEPAQNLDISGQLSFYNLLEKIYKDRKISILMVSHDLHLVMASTKKVVCLYKHICCSGEPQIVAKDPEFKTLFGNDMAKMMAVYNHQHDHKH